jgi:hypothetical protein
VNADVAIPAKLQPLSWRCHANVASDLVPTRQMGLFAIHTSRATNIPMSEVYPTIAQSAIVATALKVLLFPA